MSKERWNVCSEPTENLEIKDCSFCLGTMHNGTIVVIFQTEV